MVHIWSISYKGVVTIVHNHTSYACSEKRTWSLRDVSHFPDSSRTLTVGKSPFLAAKCRGVIPSCMYTQMKTTRSAFTLA